MSRKFGAENYDFGRYMQRGLHEAANFLYQDSPIVLRDHAGLYGFREDRNVEPSQADRDVQPPAPELEHDEPDLEL